MAVLVVGFQVIFSFRVDTGDGSDAAVREAEAGPKGVLEGGDGGVEEDGEEVAAFAKDARAAWMSSVVSSGKSARISSVRIPDASQPRISRNGMGCLNQELCEIPT